MDVSKLADHRVLVNVAQAEPFGEYPNGVVLTETVALCKVVCAGT
jgi:hypothetical protein